MQMKPIAHIHTDFPEKFGVPRQSGLVDTVGEIVFEPEYRRPEALRGIEGFSHLWLLWEFSENLCTEWSPTVRPPRLGGNARMGVFATRSPFRPNPIGLSCVKLLEVRGDDARGAVLRVLGADLMDGTPILDIKPYLPYTDCRPDATGGFAEPLREYALQVRLPSEWQGVLSPETEQQLLAVLAQDPRPSYQEDAERVYGMSFAGHTVRFTVLGEQLTVCEILKA